MKSILSLPFFAAVAFATSRLTPPPGSIVVAKSGGDFDSISSAIQSLNQGIRENQTIFVKAGTYEEQVSIPAMSGLLTIYGETKDILSYSANTVTVTYNASTSSTASSKDADTATVQNGAASTRFYNLNFANSHSAGESALALSASGTQQGYYGCQFTGNENTILTQVGGTQVFARCLIQGTSDFITGQYARVWFDAVAIRVLPCSGQGFITANGRSSNDDPSYYVINNSSVDAASDKTVTSGSYYLGRPLSDFSRVVFQDTYMSEVVNSAGWSEWTKAKPNTQDVDFGEYDNSGPGSLGSRASFSKKLSSALAVGDIINDGYQSWVDVSYLS
ncbi:uncharacterized protein PFLUO_LOCUS1238 [Penicillium psychrofluorescens]|uniref:uncharacterized protein n=1 Tax=Penicillium psychrofluorescens TaxID=3158075 RepID=UPI003CCD22FB